MALARYLNILRAQMRISATTAMQYRFDFVLKGFLSLFWLAVTLVPLLVVFSRRPTLAGWTFPESLVVLGWFSLLKSILDGGVTPSLTAVVEGVRSGAFDFVLLKPADSQFLVSTSRFDPWRILDLLGALAILVYAFARLGRTPAPTDVLVALALLFMSIAILYSFWILVVCASFWAVRVDNLAYLFGSLFDVGRWPIDVFRNAALRVIFTAVFPIALMTTYPARALLGNLPTQTLVAVFIGGGIIVTTSRLVWRRAIRAYTSASS